MIIDNYLYNREVKLTFDEFRHAYVLDGVRVPSVTTILSVIGKPALMVWAVNAAVDHVKASILPGRAYDEVQLNDIFTDARKAHTKKRQAAADIGTMVHQWIEDFIAGKNPPMPVNDRLRLSVEQFLEWKAEHKVKFLLSEQIVMSRKYHYAGKLDFICTVDGKLFLGDIKTSSDIYDEYFLQLASYQCARTEEYPNEVYAGRGIIRIGREGGFEFRTDGNYEQNLEAFLAAQKLYVHLESMKIKRGAR